MMVASANAMARLQMPLTPSADVRRAVRQLLLASGAYHGLTPLQKQELAQSLVKVCNTAVSLIQQSSSEVSDTATSRNESEPLALAQSAGSEFSGVSASRVADTTQSILRAVSFPRFVTELINGVFKAIVDSNQQQMEAFVDLIKNVSATTEGFADQNLGPDRARQWLVETFPGTFEIEGLDDGGLEPLAGDDETSEPRIRLRAGASMPKEPHLRAAFGLDPAESIPSGDPDSSLVPFARRVLARQRQQMLATMITMGMQRIVIESGRLNASMRFHIDTRSAANSESGSRFDIQNKVEASGKFGVGPWGASAKMTNTIGYVTTQKDQTSEEMNTDLDLNSSVELYFKTDYVPLDRLAGAGQVDRIKVNTLNPDADAVAARTERTGRINSARDAEAKRFAAMGPELQPNREPSTRNSSTPAAPSQSPVHAESPGPPSAPAQGSLRPVTRTLSPQSPPQSGASTPRPAPPSAATRRN